MSLRPFHEAPRLDAPPLGDSAAILVVDEDPAFQLGLKTFLREYVGFERVFTARGGREALDFIRGEPSIEVVTLDHRLPGMDGIELIRALRAQVDRPLAVVMISGHPDPGLEAEFHSLGGGPVCASRFLTKPVQFEKLEPVILAAHEEVLAAKRRAEEGALHEDAESTAAAGSIDDLAARIEVATVRLSNLERELRAQRGKWRADFWKVAFLALLVWLAADFGWLQRLEPHWERVKETLKASFDFRDVYLRRGDGPRSNSADAASPKEAPSNAVPPAPGEEPGQPL